LRPRAMSGSWATDAVVETAQRLPTAGLKTLKRQLEQNEPEPVSGQYIHTMMNLLEVARFRAEQAAGELASANELVTEIREHLEEILKTPRVGAVQGVQGTTSKSRGAVLSDQREVLTPQDLGLKPQDADKPDDSATQMVHEHEPVIAGDAAAGSTQAAQPGSTESMVLGMGSSSGPPGRSEPKRSRLAALVQAGSASLAGSSTDLLLWFKQQQQSKQQPGSTETMARGSAEATQPGSTETAPGNTEAMAPGSAAKATTPGSAEATVSGNTETMAPGSTAEARLPCCPKTGYPLRPMPQRHTVAATLPGGRETGVSGNNDATEVRGSSSASSTADMLKWFHRSAWSWK